MLNGSDIQRTDVILNEPVSFYCSVQRGRPEPNIIWSLIDSKPTQPVDLDYVKRHNIEHNSNHSLTSFRINSTRIQSSESYFYFSWLLVNTSMQFANKSLVCVVEHEMLAEPLVKTIHLNVKCTSFLVYEIL